MTLAMKMHDERWAGREEGRAEGLKEGMEKGMEKGIGKGTHDTQIRMARKLLARNMPAEEIADICSLDLFDVKKLGEDM